MRIMMLGDETDNARPYDHHVIVTSGFVGPIIGDKWYVIKNTETKPNVQSIACLFRFVNRAAPRSRREEENGENTARGKTTMSCVRAHFAPFWKSSSLSFFFSFFSPVKNENDYCIVGLGFWVTGLWDKKKSILLFLFTSILIHSGNETGANARNNNY